MKKYGFRAPAAGYIVVLGVHAATPTQAQWLQVADKLVVTPIENSQRTIVFVYLGRELIGVMSAQNLQGAFLVGPDNVGWAIYASDTAPGRTIPVVCGSAATAEAVGSLGAVEQLLFESKRIPFLELDADPTLGPAIVNVASTFRARETDQPRRLIYFEGVGDDYSINLVPLFAAAEAALHLYVTGGHLAIKAGSGAGIAGLVHVDRASATLPTGLAPVPLIGVKQGRAPVGLPNPPSTPPIPHEPVSRPLTGAPKGLRAEIECVQHKAISACLPLLHSGVNEAASVQEAYDALDEHLAAADLTGFWAQAVTIAITQLIRLNFTLTRFEYASREEANQVALACLRLQDSIAEIAQFSWAAPELLPPAQQNWLAKAALARRPGASLEAGEWAIDSLMQLTG